MSPIYFIALPLLFGFATPIIAKFGKNAVAYASMFMQLFLLFIAFDLLSLDSSYVEVISIAPPLGISFVVNSVSLLFVALFTLMMTLFSLYYITCRKSVAYENETKFFILINMLLASSIGLVLSSDIFNIYVFFEIAGISAYILSAYKKTPSALEAGIKYLITGAIASIFLVLAIVLIYLHVGSLNLATISQSFETLSYNMKVLISILLLIGFGFKVEIFPLNFWVSDVYEGSSTLVNGLFSSIVVKAYLFVFFHILYLFLPSAEFSTFLIYLGVISMLVAEIVALKQTNLKRVFAYSSLGQVGLLFATFASQNSDAISAALFIVIAHSIAKLAIFFSISSIEKEHNSVEISTLKELNSPFLKFVMLISMVSLLGLPPLAGFIGKFLALKSFAMSEHYAVIAIILVASLLESVYYFKISGAMFSKGSLREPLKLSFIQKFVLLFLVVLLFFIGSYPIAISEYINEASNAMLNSSAYVELLLGGVK